MIEVAVKALEEVKKLNQTNQKPAKTENE